MIALDGRPLPDMNNRTFVPIGAGYSVGRWEGNEQLPQRGLLQAVRRQLPDRHDHSRPGRARSRHDCTEPPSYPSPMVTSQRIGKGVWRIDQGGTAVIEFRDSVVL